MSTSSVTASQGPAGSFDVIVSTTEPLVISIAEGVNVAFNAPEPGVNTPVLPDQLALTADPPTDPLSTTSSPSQITSSLPADTMAGELNETRTSSETGKHGPIGSSDTRVKITLPALNSAAVAVYVAFKSVALGIKVPAPPVQVPVITAPLIVPLN